MIISIWLNFQVVLGKSLNIEIHMADVIDSLIANKDSTAGMLLSCVSGQDSIVRLNNRGDNLGNWLDGEFQLGLLGEI